MHKVQFLSGKKSGGNSQKLQINYKSTKQLKWEKLTFPATRKLTDNNINVVNTRLAFDQKKNTGKWNSGKDVRHELNMMSGFNA